MKRSKKLYALIFVIIVSMLAANTMVFADDESETAANDTHAVELSGSESTSEPTSEPAGEPADEPVGEASEASDEPVEENGSEPGDEPEPEEATVEASVASYTSANSSECGVCGEVLCVCVLGDLKASIAEKIEQHNDLIAEYEDAVNAFNEAKPVIEGIEAVFKDSDEYKAFVAAKDAFIKANTDYSNSVAGVTYAMVETAETAAKTAQTAAKAAWEAIYNPAIEAIEAAEATANDLVVDIRELEVEIATLIQAYNNKVDLENEGISKANQQAWIQYWIDMKEYSKAWANYTKAYIQYQLAYEAYTVKLADWEVKYADWEIEHAQWLIDNAAYQAYLQALEELDDDILAYEQNKSTYDGKTLTFTNGYSVISRTLTGNQPNSFQVQNNQRNALNAALKPYGLEVPSGGFSSSKIDFKASDDATPGYLDIAVYSQNNDLAVVRVLIEPGKTVSVPYSVYPQNGQGGHQSIKIVGAHFVPTVTEVDPPGDEPSAPKEPKEPNAPTQPNLDCPTIELGCYLKGIGTLVILEEDDLGYVKPNPDLNLPGKVNENTGNGGNGGPVPPVGGETRPPSGGGSNPVINIPAEQTPLAEQPLVQIPEEEIPLADLPQTGVADMMLLWLIFIGTTMMLTLMAILRIRSKNNA